MKCIFALFLTVILTSGLFAGGERSTDNPAVQCTVTVSQPRFRAGTTGRVFISLKPKEGIHVNLNPPIQIRLDSTGLFAFVGTPGIPKIDSQFNASKPVVLPFELSKNARLGSHSVRGTIAYFYCSDIEGWCSRFKQPIEIKITVAR